MPWDLSFALSHCPTGLGSLLPSPGKLWQHLLFFMLLCMLSASSFHHRYSSFLVICILSYWLLVKPSKGLMLHYEWYKILIGTCVILNELIVFSFLQLSHPDNSNSDTSFKNLSKPNEFFLEGFYVLLFVVHISLGCYNCSLLLLQRLAQMSPLVLIAPGGSFSIRYNLFLSPLRTTLCFSHYLECMHILIVIPGRWAHIINLGYHIIE